MQRFFSKQKLFNPVLLPTVLTYALFVVLPAATLSAAEVTVRLNPETIEVQESTTLTVTIADGGGASFEPELPDGLQIIGRQQIQNHSWINGTISRQDTFSYRVVAAKPGVFSIGPFTLRVGDQDLVSNVVTLTVVDANTPKNNARNQPASPNTGQSASARPDPANRNDHQGNTRGGRRVYLEKECDQESVYVGEVLSCRGRLFNRVPLTGIGREANRSPAFRYFEGSEKSLGRRQIGNQTYQVTEIEDILVPLKPGEHPIPPHKLQVQVVERRQVDDFFGGFGRGIFDFGFKQTVPLELESDEVTVTVKRPPKEGRPASYDGVVGDFSVTGEVSNRKITKGESVTVQVTFSGAGLLGSVKAPELPVASFAKVYEDSPVYREEPGGAGVFQSSKTFSIAIVPNRTGTFSLGEVTLPVFNPKTESYELLKTDLGSIGVLEDAAAVATGEQAASEKSDETTSQGTAGQATTGPGYEDSSPEATAKADAASAIPQGAEAPNSESTDPTLEGFRVGLTAEGLRKLDRSSVANGAASSTRLLSILTLLVAVLPLLTVLLLWLLPLIAGSPLAAGSNHAKTIGIVRKKIFRIIEQQTKPLDKREASQHLEQLMEVAELHLGTESLGAEKLGGGTNPRALDRHTLPDSQAPRSTGRDSSPSLRSAYLASKTLREALQFGNLPYDSKQLRQIHDLWRSALSKEGNVS